MRFIESREQGNLEPLQLAGAEAVITIYSGAQGHCIKSTLSEESVNLA